jgi:hypothetical protein
MDHYTLLNPLIGGILIGLASLLATVLSGKIPGISGVFGRLLVPATPDPPSQGCGAAGKIWRVVFLLGLIGGAALSFALWQSAAIFRPMRPLGVMAIAGLLVGFGTRRGNIIGTERGEDLPETREFDRAREGFTLVTGEKNFAPRERRMIAKYVSDLDDAIGEVARVLRPEGRAIYVVGDCKLRGRFIENSKLVRFLMEEHRLRWTSTRRRALPANRRYLPPPCSRKAGTQLRAAWEMK